MGYPTYDLTVSDMVKKAHDGSKENGWWDDEEWNIAEKLMLIVSEVAEAMEDIRNPSFDNEPPEVNLIIDGKPVGFLSELADVVIRVGDLCGKMNLDLESAIKLKLEYNRTRGYKHGGKAF